METTTNGPGLWNFFNALAFLILIGLVFTLALYGLSFMSHIAEIKKTGANIGVIRQLCHLHHFMDIIL